MGESAAIRVVLVGDYPPPQGGVATHVQALQSYLRGQGVRCDVLDIGEGAKRNRTARFDAGRVQPCRPGPRLVGHLVAYARSGWVIHLHTGGSNWKSWALAGVVGACASALAGKSFLTLHSGNLPSYLDSSGRGRALANLAIDRFDRVIAVSDAIADKLEQWGLGHTRSTVLPAFLASQVRAGSPPPELFTARARRSPLVAYAHHPSTIYGQSTVFQAIAFLAKNHPRIGLAIFGPGTFEPKLSALAEELGIGGRIENFGELENPQALAVIQQSDAFVRPTLVDGDSVSVREALALGTRCIASDAAVRPPGVVLFRKGDAGDLARAIEQAIGQPPAIHHQMDAGPALLSMYRQLAVEGSIPRIRWGAWEAR